jgi:gp16 family phage-associated protein
MNAVFPLPAPPVRLPGPPYPQTVESARAWFSLHGVSITEWAEANGLSVQTVYEVLNGRQAGRRGHGHTAAVALGLKPAQTGPAT